MKSALLLEDKNLKIFPTVGIIKAIEVKIQKGPHKSGLSLEISKNSGLMGSNAVFILPNTSEVSTSK